MKDFTELQVWQEAHKLTLMVYRLTEKWPPKEQFGLTNQARRSSSSIGANIAEGHGRFSNTEFGESSRLQAPTSTLEPGAWSLELGALPWQPVNEQALVVSRLLNGFMRHLREP